MPRSTSRTERRPRRPAQPHTPPPDITGPTTSTPELKGGSSRQRRGTPRSRPPAPDSRLRLADTPGPDPDVSPRTVLLTIGTILAPHGVRGEFKVRLQTDGPEHLLKVKRIYLGDEKTPRTVLGVRLHAGHALIRLQGISTPETVKQLRGTPLRIRGSDARPLAPNEYFLYQVIGLEAFDEAGNRLGRVTDLIETGANDVLVITPDDGPDILLPSHPDVVRDLDPAAGHIVIRPLVYYDE